MYCAGLSVLVLCFWGVWAVVPPKDWEDESPVVWTPEPPKRVSATKSQTPKKPNFKNPPLSGRYLEIFNIIKEFVDKSKGRIDFRELGKIVRRRLNETTKRPMTAQQVARMWIARGPPLYW